MAAETMEKRESLAVRASALAMDFQDVTAATKRMATDSVDAVRQSAVDVFDEGLTKEHRGEFTKESSNKQFANESNVSSWHAIG